MIEGGLHKDEGKSLVTSIPPGFILEVGEVFAANHEKYPDIDGQPNYCAGLRYTRLIGSALRHVLKFSAGQDNNEDTGLSHLSHAACCLAMLWYMWSTCSADLDDRMDS